MNYATIKYTDIANGIGVRVSLFVSGCRHHCRGCFNPETWDFCYGKPFTDEVMEDIMNACAPDYIEGLSLLGGDPFEPKNIPTVLRVAKEFKKRYPNKTIWCYTGYDFDKDVMAGKLADKETTAELLSCIDILVDGEFHLEEKDLKLRFRGSSNQRVINVPDTLLNYEKDGKIVHWDENE